MKTFEQVVSEILNQHPEWNIWKIESIARKIVPEVLPIDDAILNHTARNRIDRSRRDDVSFSF